MRNIITSTLIGLSLVTTSVARSQSNTELKQLTIATWNLEHLAEKNGEGCRPRQNADYQLLQSYANRLLDEKKVDIITLQEVENEAAAHRVFPASKWNIVLASRPSSSQPRKCRENPNNTLTTQLAGFAIRKDIVFEKEKDLEALDLSNLGLRRGAYIIVKSNSQPLHLLAVHLKSGCFSDSLSNPPSNNSSCKELATQLPILEKWIDERVKKGERFAIAGDLNRRLNIPGDEFWQEIDDSEPDIGADLETITEGRLSSCNRYKDYIDHIVLDKGVTRAVSERSFFQLVYKEAESEHPSDHCPIGVTIDMTALKLSPDYRWRHNSLEYRTITRSVFERAAARLEELIKEQNCNSNNRAKCVIVVDIDETILDNSGYDKIAQELLRTGFDRQLWDTWVENAEAELVPGADILWNLALSRGVKIAAITNRTAQQAEITRTNLEKLGLNASPEKVCILGKTEKDQSTETHNSKDLRRRLVEQGTAENCWKEKESIVQNIWQQPHQILLYVGDNIEDFPQIKQNTINAGQMLEQIDKSFFLLPNATYGSWD
ncbi:hypothetical protein C7H19_15550 [Aphanothece hegewaldii CCALA 016]|uniref:Endonuclease/exonuclease/phosphatase domain-containing protein n=1 Tax=Aphanothece hegewaldii CCALA 016 TaxID=2107694 RepID=A0A2T1LVB1_9CHRO|nr:HAD family acid phosphatase [Aphanothece hegewaldii]PSF35656.1 hypothetical protein C7H19_15550 [Aphanothece hegewaldii CCALA 016]